MRERLRSSLWVLPTLAVLFALVLGTALSNLPAPQGPLRSLLFTGSAEGARSLLSTVAGAMITTIGVIFSLTVLALQMAAGQYSPRVMRNFLRDRGNQVVLAVFLATFAYSVAVLRVIRQSSDGQKEVVPALAVSVGILLILASLGMLVYFIQHLTGTIRVEHILRDAERTTMGTIRAVYGPRGEDRPGPGMPDVPAAAVAVPARRTGYVQAASPEELIGWAGEHDLVVRYRPTIGAHVVEGAVLAWVWRRDGGPPPEDVEPIAVRVDRPLSIGFERTSQQDVAFGVRQIVDIAVRALSPGVNDPTTAVDAIGSLTGLLTELARRDLGDRIGCDDAGVVRVALPHPSLGQYVDLCCDQIRRYGAHDPAVLSRLLRMLVDVARSVSGSEPEAQAAVGRQARLILADAQREVAQQEDLVDLPQLAEIVAESLAGKPRPEPTRAS